MSETTDEEQAAMAIKLADNVRDLIRSEVKPPIICAGISQTCIAATFSYSSAEAALGETNAAWQTTVAGSGILTAKVF